MSTVPRPTVEPEVYQGTLLIRGGQPGQYVRVELEDVPDLCAALMQVRAQPHPAPKSGHVPTDLQQPQSQHQAEDGLK